MSTSCHIGNWIYSTMCWLFYVSNLLVIQHLEALYLGGNNVRVVCERVWRIDQVCAIKRQLTTGSRDWLVNGDSLECVTRVKHVGSWRVSTVGLLQDKNYRLAFWLSGNWNSWLIPVTSDLPVHHILLKNDFSYSFSYPTINTLILTKCIEISERSLREKP